MLVPLKEKTIAMYILNHSTMTKPHELVLLPCRAPTYDQVARPGPSRRPSEFCCSAPGAVPGTPIRSGCMIRPYCPLEGLLIVLHWTFGSVVIFAAELMF